MTLNIAQRLALNLDSHIAIDAGAGTGKTSTVVERVIEHYLCEDQRATRLLPTPERPTNLDGGFLISAGSERINLEDWKGLLPNEVVLLTFTNLAADEMRDRLRRRISEITYGSFSRNKGNDEDFRAKSHGFIEQLLMLLEDAPIGTIDSFFNQIVTPYRSILDDKLGTELVSDFQRNNINNQAINTMWRLSSSKSRVGDAIDAGIPPDLVEQILESRDRIAEQFSSHTSITNLLNSIISKSLFIEEAERRIKNENGQIDSKLLISTIISSIEEQDIEFFSNELYSQIFTYCQIIRSHITFFAPNGWNRGTRISHLTDLSDLGPPEDEWEKLVWIGKVMLSISNILFSNKLTIFPNNKLPNYGDWDPGIPSWSGIKPKSTKDLVKNKIIDCVDSIKRLCNSEIGKRVLHHSELALILDYSDPNYQSNLENPIISHVPEPITERSPYKSPIIGYNLNSEITNMNDIMLILKGLKGIISNIKRRSEVHDYSDISALLSELLLDKCPNICRAFYPPEIISILDNSNNEPWNDNHINLAFSTLEEIEKIKESRTIRFSKLREVRQDLENRYNLLKQIRRRYRAFIIDEAQDNSPQQWRLLSRLWGPRKIHDHEGNNPDTDWEPTICFVGDMKQSIYAFRQAEVSGFRKFSRILRNINNEEFSNISELTRKPVLRSIDASRNSLVSDNFSIIRASELTFSNSKQIEKWIPFNSPEGDYFPTENEIKRRSEGLISLQVNYRTSAGLLKVMNNWWEDIFSPRHRFFPKSDYYADFQNLFPSESNKDKPGIIEWICPQQNSVEDKENLDLYSYYDPFSIQSKNSIERQAIMISKRVKSLISGKSTRVMDKDGIWKEIPQNEKLDFSDILILMASRSKLRDPIIRHLRDQGIPAQADREGPLLSRQVISDLDGLIQLLARPHSRNAAAWVARSTLIGMTDFQLQDFLKPKEKTNFLSRLREFTSDRQRKLVERWISQIPSGNLIQIIEDTVDYSDILIANNDDSSFLDISEFIELIEHISSNFGGDKIVIADKIREIREQTNISAESKIITNKNCVRLMSIHASKGLESKVVILADLFSDRQVSMTLENRNKIIISPEIFAGNPNPWSPSEKPISAIWKHARQIHSSRKDAEARRLLYVAATRAQNQLIIVGSPKNTEWVQGKGLEIPWKYSKSRTQLGQMWIEAIRQSSWKRKEISSPWLQPNDLEFPTQPKSESGTNILINPSELSTNGFISGEKTTNSLIVYHKPECFNTDIKAPIDIDSPLTNHININKRAHETKTKENINHFNFSSQSRITLAPHKLSTVDRNPEAYFMEIKGGVTNLLYPDNSDISTKEWDEKMEINPQSNLPDSSTLGLIIHRIIELGIGNPSNVIGGPFQDLPATWTQFSPNRLLDEKLLSTVFDELMPLGIDYEVSKTIINKILNRISSGIVGRLTSGENIDHHSVDGLRTEFPFFFTNHIQVPPITRSRWTPSGRETVRNINSVKIDMSGSIDLVLCTQSNSKSYIRPIDLKTSQAFSVLDDSGSLMETFGSNETTPLNQAEYDLLMAHSLQLALYHSVLEKIEKNKPENKRREVVLPGLLVGVTGRLLIYPEEMFNDARSRLENIFIKAAKIYLSSVVDDKTLNRRILE